MNEKIVINLVDFIDGDSAYGNQEGRDVYQKILTELDKYPGNNIFGISLMGIVRTDASFPRESVVSLVKSRRGEKGFYLQDFISTDLRDNWAYAANAKEQPIIIISDDGYEVLGDLLNSSSKDLLDFVMESKKVTTSMVASKLDVSAQNASSKLKKLHSLGLVLGSKQPADSGGMEFVYTSIQ